MRSKGIQERRDPEVTGVHFINESISTLVLHSGLYQPIIKHVIFQKEEKDDNISSKWYLKIRYVELSSSS